MLETQTSQRISFIPIPAYASPDARWKPQIVWANDETLVTNWSSFINVRVNWMKHC